MKLLRAGGLAVALWGALALPASAQQPAGVGTAPAPGLATAPGDAVTALATEEAIDRLLAVIRDDDARAALIARLEEARAGDPAAGPEDPAVAPNLAQRLATATAAIAAAAGAEVTRAARELARVGDLADRVRGVAAARGAEVAALGATILSTIAASLAFDGAAGAMARRLRPPAAAGPGARAGRALVALGLHFAAQALAWTAGYALATLLFAQANAPSEAQTLYLNAFAAFGLARVALRAVANPDAGHEPTLLSFDARLQRTSYRALRAVAGVVAQGFLFVVPLVQLWAGFAAVRPVRALVATAAALVALWAVRAVARAQDRAGAPRPPLAAPAPEATGPAPDAAGGGGTAGAAWRRLWPPLAALYVGYVWLTALARPALLEEVVIGGTAMTGAAVALVVAGLHVLRRAPALRAPLPPRAARRLPGLRPRADRIAAAGGVTLAVGLIAGAILLLLAAWTDLGAFLSRAAVQAALWRVLSALLVVGGAAVAWAVVASWIDARLSEDAPGRPGLPGRSRTLLSLFRNAFGVTAAAVAAMVALSQLGLDIAPLLAGAGVVGIAVGFGAQTLVRDVITGIFIQLENAIDVGDVVTVAGVTGGVEKVTIRSVRLRALDGATHIIPFSSVTTVQNLSRDFGYHVAQLLVGYAAGPGPAKAALAEAFDRLKAGPGAADVLGPLDMQGVVEMRDAAMLVRARIMTRPGRQWAVGQRYGEILAGVLTEQGVEAVAPGPSILLPPGAPGAA